MERICVVHLARAKNGLPPFERFLASYCRMPAGLAHDLLIVYKGFGSRDSVACWEKTARGCNHKSLLIPDIGFDLRAFRVAAEWAQHSHLFFLNSFSEILADDWLAKPYSLMQQREVGIVGATGSWESMRTNAMVNYRRSPALYAKIQAFVRLKACELIFDPFPNYHVRTNAFLMARVEMLRLWPRYILTKRGAYMFENGSNSLTKRIINLGLRPLVVDRFGAGFEKEAWARSKTFRNANQENLLVADNQTRAYQEADASLRRRLAVSAWGDDSV